MVIIPAFIVTELMEAFALGFAIYLPFLIIDLVVSNVLLALGMQMMNPTQVSLPFKLLLFVAIDGWGLLAQALITGYRVVMKGPLRNRPLARTPCPNRTPPTAGARIETSRFREYSTDFSGLEGPSRHAGRPLRGQVDSDLPPARMPRPSAPAMVARALETAAKTVNAASKLEVGCQPTS